MNAVTEQEKIAHHEAAHAVLYHCFRHPVESVEIQQDTGCCVLPAEWDKSFSQKRLTELARREVLFEKIVAACAGRAAMDKWHGYKASTDENWKASNDYAQAFSYALEVNSGDREGAELLVAWLIRRAELLVERQWSQIHKLAFALLEHERIAAPELHKIMHESKDSG